MATRFTDTNSYYVSESSVYRLLKAHDLIGSPAFIVIKAADEFKDKTTAPNQLWQTDFTYLKVIGWGWYYLSTILDDYSRYIIAWKLCTTMRADDVTETLELALMASGCGSAKVVKGSDATPSDSDDCNISRKPPNLKPKRARASVPNTADYPKAFEDGQALAWLKRFCPSSLFQTRSPTT